MFQGMEGSYREQLDLFTDGSGGNHCASRPGGNPEGFEAYVEARITGDRRNRQRMGMRGCREGSSPASADRTRNEGVSDG